MLNVSNGKSLGPDEIRAMRSRVRSDVIARHIPNILDQGLYHRALHVTGDLEIDGDLVLDDAEIQVLIVDGNLTVHGRLEDRDDEEIESLVLVGGRLTAGDLFTFGSLEVHGDLVVKKHLLLRDNACSAHVEGDVHAPFVLDQYHHCNVLGDLHASIALLDSPERIVCKKLVGRSFGFTDPELAAVLDHGVLNGQEVPDAPHGFLVDSVAIRAVSDWIRAGRSVFQAGQAPGGFQETNR